MSHHLSAAAALAHRVELQRSAGCCTPAAAIRLGRASRKRRRLAILHARRRQRCCAP